MRGPAVTLLLVLIHGVAIVEIGRAAEKTPLAITAIDPSHAAFGTKIKIAGHGFRGTKKVWFVVGYVHSKEAKFRALSESELEVEVPEFLTTDIRAALVVETAVGVTVTMPPELLTVANPSTVRGDKFTLVQSGGALQEGGDWVTFVEKGASVLKAGRISLVASGGRLDDLRAHGDKSDSLIFAEPGAAIADQAKKHATVISVPHVSYSPVDELFAYEPGSELREPQYEASASAAPRIAAIKPNLGIGGDIVEIHGTGLGGARSVAFVQSLRRYEAAFRRKSDSVLRVEVPNVNSYWDAVVIVENSQGVAFTLSRVPRSEDGTVAWVDKAGTHLGTGRGIGAGVAMVEAGGVLARGEEVCFVKDGGTLLAAGGGIKPVVYCEPQAKLASPLPGASEVVQVSKIVPCPVDSYFNASRGRTPFGPSR